MDYTVSEQGKISSFIPLGNCQQQIPKSKTTNAPEGASPPKRMIPNKFEISNHRHRRTHLKNMD